MTIDEQAVAAFRARVQLDWDEHDRILADSGQRNEVEVLFKYAHLLQWAYLTLFQRKFPNATRNDIIRYVADLRTEPLVLHPREMNPRLAEDIIIGALRGEPVTTLTQQGYDAEAMGAATDFLMEAIFADAGLDQAENFDQLINELQPRLEDLEIPDGLPDQLDNWLDQMKLTGNSQPDGAPAKPAEG